MISVLERFMSKVSPNPITGCWEWTAGKDPASYGYFHLNGRRQKAHRAAYKIFVGPFPEGLLMRHKCDNPPCVNPAHLEPGTYADNARDMWDRGRAAGGPKAMAEKTHCVRGHALVAPNLKPTALKQGFRNCLACSRAQYAKHDRIKGVRMTEAEVQTYADQQYADIMAQDTTFPALSEPVAA